MTITIIGSNTIEGIKLKKNIIKIANNLNRKITIKLLDNINKEKAPILYINNELISTKKAISEKRLVKLLKRDDKETNNMV